MWGRVAVAVLWMATAAAVCGSAGAASAASPSPSPATGRIAVAEAGFEITLADGWERKTDVGYLGYAGAVLLALPSRATSDSPWFAVSMIPADMLGDDPADGIAKGIDAQVERTTARLPAGLATRLDWTSEGRRGIAYVLGGGQIVESCHGVPVVHVLMASLPAGEAGRTLQDVESMASSFVQMRLGAVECGPAGGPAWTTPAVAWSHVATLGKYGDSIWDALGWPGGFVAVGTACPETTPSGDRCPVAEDAVAWVSETGEQWDRVTIAAGSGATDVAVEAALGGLVAVETRKGAAAVYTSTDGRAWSQASRIGGTGRCNPRFPSDPSVNGVYSDGAGLVVTGKACADGDSVDRVYESRDAVSWGVVKKLPSGLTTKGIAHDAGSPGRAAARTAAWYLAVGNNPDALGLWMWVSPDAERWRELAAPKEIAPTGVTVGTIGLVIAGRGETVVLFTSASGYRGSDVWLGRIAGEPPQAAPEPTIPPQEALEPTSPPTDAAGPVGAEQPPLLIVVFAGFLAAAVGALATRRLRA